MWNHNYSEQSANAQTRIGETEEDPQSFSPKQLKNVSSEEPQDFELREGELGQI